MRCRKCQRALNRLKKIFYKKQLILLMRYHLIREFGLLAAKVNRVLKVDERSVILQGTFHGESVVFKMFLAPEKANIVNRASIELQFLEANLKLPFFANKVIAAAPAVGIIVLSLVPGLSVKNAMRQADPSEREEILEMAGNWLRYCASLRMKKQALQPRKFIAKLQSLDVHELEIVDRSIIDGMFVELQRLSDVLKGTQVGTSIAHNDLKMPNLHWFKGMIYAVDIQCSRREPVMRGAAHFLVAKDLRKPMLQPDMFFGLDADDAKLLLNAAGLMDTPMPVIRFFIGEQMVRIYLNGYHKFSKTRGEARERMQSFLANSAG